VGADINVQSEDGRTPLHMTAIHGRFTRSKTLIDHGECDSRLHPILHNPFTIIFHWPYICKISIIQYTCSTNVEWQTLEH